MHRYPQLALRLGEIAGVKVPAHDLAVAASNSHQLPDRPPVETDGTIRFLSGGEPVFFAQVEVQRRHDEDKYAVLRAYHGSEVSKAKAGGHMFVVSPKTAETAKFRRSEAARGEEYAYRGSYLSSVDLRPMAGAERPFEERCFAIGMTDFSRGVPDGAAAMLREASEQDATVANLLFRAIVEEVTDVSMVEGVLQPDILDKLRGLKAFRDYEERVKASADAEAKAKVEAEAEAAAREAAAKAEAAAREAAARAESAAREAAAEAEARATLESKADDLTQIFFIRGEKLSDDAFSQISECREVSRLSYWLRRAFAGETAAEIFPES